MAQISVPRIAGAGGGGTSKGLFGVAGLAGQSRGETRPQAAKREVRNAERQTGGQA